MTHKCSVITGIKDGKYTRCGLEASYEALPWEGNDSDWKYCEKHNEYYAKPKGYPTKLIEEKC
jgi:hypothetical protein